MKPPTERKKYGRKIPAPTARSLDDCVSSTDSTPRSGALELDAAPTARVGRWATDQGRPQSDLDHMSSGFSSYLPTGKQREQRVRAQLRAQGYAPTDQSADWGADDSEQEPQAYSLKAQSLAAAYDTYGADDEATAAAYDAYGREDEPDLGAPVYLPESQPEPPEPAPPEVSFAQHDALEDEALRALLGPAYAAAIGATAVLDHSAAPDPIKTQAKEGQSLVVAETSRSLETKGAVGQPLASAGPGRPLETKGAVGRPRVAAETSRSLETKGAVGQPLASAGPSRPLETKRAVGEPWVSAGTDHSLETRRFAEPAASDTWDSPWGGARELIPPLLPDEAYLDPTASAVPPWLGAEPPMPDDLPETVEPPSVLPGPLGQTRNGRRGDRLRQRAPQAESPASYVKDLNDVSSTVQLHPYDEVAPAGRGRRARRGTEVKDLDTAASTVSLPFSEATSGYSVELDATGAGAAEVGTKGRHGKKRGRRSSSSHSASSLDDLSAGVTLPLSGRAVETEPRGAPQPQWRSARWGASAASLDDMTAGVTLPLRDRAEESAAVVPAAGALAEAPAAAPAAADEVTLAYNEMIRLLTAREYSAAELTRKCRGRFAPEAVATALARCQAQGFQSDERYADLLVRHMRLALYGSYKLKLEAERKGVAWHLIEAALAANELDWFELAYECLAKKYRASDLADYKTKVKANAFLGRRGFATAEREYALARLERGE